MEIEALLFPKKKNYVARTTKNVPERLCARMVGARTVAVAERPATHKSWNALPSFTYTY